MLSTISILEHHVYLWVIPLQDDTLVAALHQPSLLSPEERVRAGRLAGDNRQHYIVSHCALRIILGRLCGIAPHALRLRSMPGGRPELDHQDTGLRFSLSHSGAICLLAVTGGAAIGSDLEQIRPLPDLDLLALRLLPAASYAAWLQLPKDRRGEAFFRWWARWEAVGKALGYGIATHHGSVAVPLYPETVVLQPGGQEGPLWVQPVSISDGYASAIALSGARTPPTLHSFTLGPEDLAGEL
jgi:4'-phosphopantetheinyl transferase